MKTNTTWEPVSSWYDQSIGEKGDFTHRTLVIPKSISLLSLHDNSALLDLGCGQGILGREIPQSVGYTGVDTSTSLIENARKRDRNPKHRYYVADVTRSIPVPVQSFSHAAAILMMDNVQHPKEVIKTAKKHLHPHGLFLFVINHPAFRIPRQASWGIDNESKIQYRRINRYLSPLSIPITLHPSQKESSPVTWTFHYPISAYSQWLNELGFSIELIQEWTWNKTSAGKAGKMEDRARNEFPLFLAVTARLIT